MRARMWLVNRILGLKSKINDCAFAMADKVVLYENGNKMRHRIYQQITRFLFWFGKVLYRIAMLVYKDLRKRIRMR